MNFNEAYNYLCSIGCRVELNADMSEHTSFRAGGKAALLAFPTRDRLKPVISELKKLQIPTFIMGLGSNLLVRQGGFNGAIIKLDMLDKLTVNGNTITAEAGVRLTALTRAAIEHSLSGLEFAGGIPGSVGGGVFMNAGAYDGEIKDCITSVTALDTELNEVTLLRDDLKLGYRTSIFHTNGFIILDATFTLPSGNSEESEAIVKDLNSRRREKQPVEYPSAGSTFKRPPGYYAGTLIDECGLKGASVGGAEVSKKHAGFIINKGGATAKDITELIKHVQDTVYTKKGVMLETEVRIIGD